MSHKRLAQFGIVVAAAVIVGLVTSSMHAQAPGKGSLSGRVLTSDGKPAANFAVRLEQSIPIGAAPRTSGFTADANGLQGGRIKVIARANTNQNGEFQFQNVTEGTFILVGGNNNMGWIYYPCEIEPNKETKLGDITLAKT